MLGTLQAVRSRRILWHTVILIQHIKCHILKFKYYNFQVRKLPQVII